jgi:hypothetical protein
MSSSENQSFVSFIKCLYNSSSYIIPLRISDICFNAYAERYGVEFEYIGQAYSIDTRLITLVEELGLEQCSGHGTFLLCQPVPEELKDYIDIRFNKGIKKACIDYDRVYADILHKQIVDCESGEIYDADGKQKVYESYTWPFIWPLKQKKELTRLNNEVSILTDAHVK